ncbi:aldo/keto reductase [Phenylobacterium sp.]|uniref:aldo/keto reductase n=1 Tax=Phenylobacterium sp. TaxID=1871053 RepID=UPI002F407354
MSVAGLGCGGNSRLGMARGATTEQAADLVRHALDLGVTFIDTAQAYGTEAAVGLGVAGRRDGVFISTKCTVRQAGGGEWLAPADLAGRIEDGLRQLRTDRIDLFNLHAVRPDDYDEVVERLVPELRRQQQAGKIRFLGVTELFQTDTRHEMLARAVPDGIFDVVMVGFNLLNPSARRSVFPLTRVADVGTQIMFAVRRALSRPEVLRELVATLVAEGQVAPDAVNPDDPLDFVTRSAGAGSVVEAAYRFCRHEAGADVILTGTGDPRHLSENVAAILGPPLPAGVLQRLEQAFGRVDSVSGL